MLGGAIAVIGALILATVNGDSSLWHLAAACFVMGIGFGYVASPGVVAAQTAVSWARRGVATGANMFSRSVGSAVGVAVFGAIVNSHVSDALGSSSPDLEHVSSAILEPAIHDVYVVSAFIAAALLAVAFLMPTPGHRAGRPGRGRAGTAPRDGTGHGRLSFLEHWLNERTALIDVARRDGLTRSLREARRLCDQVEHARRAAAALPPSAARAAGLIPVLWSVTGRSQPGVAGEPAVDVAVLAELAAGTAYAERVVPS